MLEGRRGGKRDKYVKEIEKQTHAQRETHTDPQRERAGKGSKLLPGCKERNTPTLKTFWGHFLIASSLLAAGGPLT